MSNAPEELRLASPEDLAESVLDWAKQRGWGEDHVILHQGVKHMSVRDVSDAIRKGTEFGQDLFKVIVELRRLPSVHERPPLTRAQQAELIRQKMATVHAQLKRDGVIPPGIDL